MRYKFLEELTRYEVYMDKSVILTKLLADLRQRLNKPHQRTFLDDLSDIEDKQLSLSMDPVFRNRILDYVLKDSFLYLPEDLKQPAKEAWFARDYARLRCLFIRKGDEAQLIRLEDSIKMGGLTWDPKNDDLMLRLRIAEKACEAMLDSSDEKLAEAVAERLSIAVNPPREMWETLMGGACEW